jgi:CBS domain-containing protein
MRCEDIMKRNVLCVRESSSCHEAAALMRDENVGFLPVCDDENRAVGTITDRDICIRVDAAGKLASQTPVSTCMSREVVACRPWDDIAEAERLMATHHKSRIICTDEQGVILGVISLSDIAERDSLRRAAATLREVASREARL